jgi:NAD(P)-dependent dehydrogenase (short-subunit alcohol dehydrogenase family)
MALYSLEASANALTREDTRMGRLDGRAALVTGAGRGFGRVLFLAAAEADYLTGQVLQPNGGWVMA